MVTRARPEGFPLAEAVLFSGAEVRRAMWLLACGLMILGGGTPSAQDTRRQSAIDRAELAHLEAVWNDAHERGDAGVLDELWAPELIVTVQGMPVMKKADSLAIWRSGRMKFERYATSNLETLIFGDAAVVTGRVERQRRVDGRSVADDWRFTKVYVRREGRWRVVAWHASDAPR